MIRNESSTGTVRHLLSVEPERGFRIFLRFEKQNFSHFLDISLEAFFPLLMRRHVGSANERVIPPIFAGIGSDVGRAKVRGAMCDTGWR